MQTKTNLFLIFDLDKQMQTSFHHLPPSHHREHSFNKSEGQVKDTPRHRHGVAFLTWGRAGAKQV